MSLRGKLMSFLFVLFLADWQQKLRLLLTGLLLIQYTAWFQVYWLKNTEWLVAASLVIAFLTEYFPQISVSIRRLGALLLIVLMHFYKLDISLTVVPLGESSVKEYLASIGETFAVALGETAPYIWFSIGAWLVYLASVYWMRERARIMVYIVLSVIIFAVVDSYSKYILWDQVAVIVFCGLGLIIIEHYEHFRRQHPAIWSYLAEYPGKVAVPVVVIVSLVMAAGVMAPNARPLLKDPYTIYKHWMGEKVITGGKGFSDAGSGNFYRLDASSGYGRSDEELGGGFEYDYSEVMRVTSSQRTYWRGETKSLYTGRGWIAAANESNSTTVPVEAGTALESFEWGSDDTAEKAEIKQRVMMTDPDVDYPVLFGAFEIHSVALEWSTSDTSEESVPVKLDARWASKHGELRWDDANPYPLVYEVVSAIPVTNEAGWRTVGSQKFDNPRWAPYLQLPDTLPDRVRSLAAEVTASAQTPYDKVKSIETYLQENFQYKSRPDLSKGKSEDFVDRFLFEIQEGYCDYFSSAMAVMVRSIGLPARWVKGFQPGIYELDDIFQGAVIPEEIARLEAGGEMTYIVRNSDAHSWVEVYFPGYGWLPFEPTSGMSLPVVEGAEEALPTLGDVNNQSLAAEESKSGSWQWVTMTMISAAITAVIAGLAAAAWRLGMLGKMTARFARNKEERNFNQQALAEVGRILKIFRRKGYARANHETARESFARWAEKNKWLNKDLNVLLAVLEKARYSPYSVTAEDLSELLRTRKRLKEEL